MNTDQERINQLAAVLDLSAVNVGRHIMRPLAQPMATVLKGWQVPEICQRIFAITDGFWLFGQKIWNGFKFWDSHDYQLNVWMIENAIADKLFPIVGEVPHLVSISTIDGAVLKSDWEVRHQPEHGWGEIIAPTLQDYIRTLIQIREAYPDDGERPSEWWAPYANSGVRYDLK